MAGEKWGSQSLHFRATAEEKESVGKGRAGEGQLSSLSLPGLHLPTRDNDAATFHVTTAPVSFSSFDSQLPQL